MKCLQFSFQFLNLYLKFMGTIIFPVLLWDLSYSVVIPEMWCKLPKELEACSSNPWESESVRKMGGVVAVCVADHGENLFCVLFTRKKVRQLKLSSEIAKAKNVAKVAKAYLKGDKSSTDDSRFHINVNFCQMFPLL